MLFILSERLKKVQNTPSTAVLANNFWVYLGLISSYPPSSTHQNNGWCSFSPATPAWIAPCCGRDVCFCLINRYSGITALSLFSLDGGWGGKSWCTGLQSEGKERAFQSPQFTFLLGFHLMDHTTGLLRVWLGAGLPWTEFLLSEEGKLLGLFSGSAPSPEDRSSHPQGWHEG